MVLSRPVVLLIGSGHPVYREYLLRSAGHRRPLWLLDLSAPTWQSPYLAGASTVDVFDVGGLLAAAREVARARGVSGVLCYDEALILPAAQVAAALGLPGPPVEAVANCRDKHRTRAALARAGVPQPGSVLVGSVDDAARAADDVGYPVVLKPRGLGASQGVIRVDDPAALPAAWEVANGAAYPGVPTYDEGVLVEEYLDGPEISVDSAVLGPDARPLYLARKTLGPAPYFEEIGHLVSADDPLLHDAGICDILRSAHRALGVRDTITHTELRLTTAGPKVIEVNGRLGGDLIPYVGLLATGIDPGVVAADLATGTTPDLAPTRRRTAGIRFLYPPRDGRIGEASLPAPSARTGLDRAEVIAPAGTVLRLPPRGYLSRWALLTCVADGVEDCRDRLDRVAAEARASFQDVDSAEPGASWHSALTTPGGGQRPGRR